MRMDQDTSAIMRSAQLSKSSSIDQDLDEEDPGELLVVQKPVRFLEN